MKKYFQGIAFFLSQAAFAQDQFASKYAQQITAADLKENLSIIASDALEGRYTGSRGQKMAAAFIANHFESLGLGAPVNGSHYMPIDLTSTKTGDVSIKVGTTRCTNHNEFIYFGQSDSGGEISLEAVYVGRGTEAEYACLNVKDKAAVIYVDSLRFSIFRKVRGMAKLALDKGARVVLVASGGKPEKFKTFVDQVGFAGNESLSLTKPDPNNPNKGTFYIDQSIATKI